MGIHVELSIEELTALRKSVYASQVQEQVAAEIGAADLASADTKLERAAEKARCANPPCDRFSRRSNGLCDRCNSYQTKYGRLPSEDTIVRSSRQVVDRPQEARRPRRSDARRPRAALGRDAHP